MYKTVWCEGGLKLADIVTNNVIQYEFNARLQYTMSILENWQKTFIRGVVGDRMTRLDLFGMDSTQWF